MRSRLQLQSLLEEILESRNVYFQPPENIKLKFPCIVYQLNNYENIAANNNPYIQFERYSITLIDSDPESKVMDKLSMLPRSTFDRSYASDGLYHSVFSIYY